MKYDDQLEVCEACDGRGWVEDLTHMHTPNGLEEVWGEATCDTCNGEGLIDLEDAYL